MQCRHSDIEDFLKSRGFYRFDLIPDRSIDERSDIWVTRHSGNPCRGAGDRPSSWRQRVEVALALRLRRDHRKHLLLEQTLLHRAGREADSLRKAQDLVLVGDLYLA